jgi:hypothetical protein
MLCGIDNILQNIPHIHTECGKYLQNIFMYMINVMKNVVRGLNTLQLGREGMGKFSCL